MLKILDNIQNPNDIKNIEPEQLKQLAAEIRRFLIEKISSSGGHLASNLGVVELTMALHLFLEFPEDKLIWDVGHQAYTHKILTGRKEGFDHLRKYNGMSGFPKRRESECDAFDTGHSSTSISAALGFAKARDLAGRNNKVFAVIGDGALSGGMAYEALNNAARLKSNMVIVLNDNNMSISENVGGMSAYLGKIRSSSRYIDLKTGVETILKKIPKIGNSIADKVKRSKDSIKRLVIPGMLFEDMGITYIGPIDGHNIEQLITAFSSACKLKEAVIVHVVTKKGKGYIPAERNPEIYHGIDPFTVRTGHPKKLKKHESYTHVFSEALKKCAEEDEKVLAITAAMPLGTGLNKFRESFPNRFFDVGIAEEHAVTFAAGLAAEGFKPIVAIYSTFLQRSYDQIIHDVCINKFPVVFAIDRAGIVGRDGETHQGIFDLSYLSSIPDMIVMAPKNDVELAQMLKFGLGLNAPVAIRYPRGRAFKGLKDFNQPLAVGKSEIIYKEKEIAILALGSMIETGLKVRDTLISKGHSVTFINVRFAFPLDEELLNMLIKDHSVIITMEENIRHGGYGELVSSYLCRCEISNVKHINISLPNEFVAQGDFEVLRKELKIDHDSIIKYLKERGIR